MSHSNSGPGVRLQHFQAMSRRNAKVLTTIRERACMSQEEVAEKMRIPVRLLNAAETGRVLVSESFLTSAMAVVAQKLSED